MIRNKKLKHESTIVDPETGEIITSSKTFSVKVNQDEFYMTYIENMSGFFDLRSAVDMKVLTKFCISAEYNTGKIVLSVAERQSIMAFLGISSQQLSNAINSLKTHGLLDGEKGTYYINPLVFWKGKNEIRNTILKEGKLTLNIEFGGDV